MNGDTGLDKENLKLQFHMKLYRDQLT